MCIRDSGYLGRVVDPMGRPLDGMGEISNLEGRRVLELQAPGVMMRKSVHEPLQTGLKAIDTMIPVSYTHLDVYKRQGLYFE